MDRRRLFFGVTQGGAEGWNVSTASFLQDFNVGSQTVFPRSITLNTDGTKMYTSANNNIYEYDLSTAWSSSSATYLQSYNMSAQISQTYGIKFNNNGTKMYLIGQTQTRIYEYDLSTGWDISSSTYLQNFNLIAQGSGLRGFYFKPDGTKLYTIRSTSDNVNEYDLSTAWDVSSLSHLRTFSVSTQFTLPFDVSFKTDGTKMYILGYSNNKIYEYDLSTAWNISSSVVLQNFDVTTQDGQPLGIAFKPNGIKMYVTGADNDKVYEYDLTS
jgi:DNA-binding beta-propeller fold protein YncE